MTRLFGGCLLAAGILIGGASGLCALVSLASLRNWRDLPATVIGFGIPLAIGFGLAFAGQRRISADRGYRD